MANPHTFESLCSVDDLRKMLDVGRNTAYSLLNDGSIKAYKVGRRWKIPESSIKDYLQSLESSSKGQPDKSV